MTTRKLEIDLSLVEEFAARGLTKAATAEALKVKPKSFLQRCVQDASVREAWERGRARAGDTKRKAPLAESAQPVLAAVPASVIVLNAIAQEHRTFAQLLKATGLTHNQCVVRVERLMQERRIFARNIRGERQHFLAGEAVPEEPTLEAPEPAEPAQPVEATLVSDARLAPAVNTPSKRRPREKTIAVRRPQQHDGNGHAPIVEASDTRLRRAAEAALVEINFSAFWREPSNKSGEVRQLLVDALRPSVV